MTLETIYKELEKLENDLEYYENRLESLKSLVMPKATQLDNVKVDGGKHIDSILKYVELENQQQLEATIDYIKNKMQDLNTLKDKEIERLAKFGEAIKAVVFLREKEFIVDGYGKKRHLYLIKHVNLCKMPINLETKEIFLSSSYLGIKRTIKHIK